MPPFISSGLPAWMIASVGFVSKSRAVAADTALPQAMQPSVRIFEYLEEHPMNKALIALATSFTLLAAGTAGAQVGKAASDATDAVQHKIDEKQADSKAKKSGPVGKAVNNVKSGYHKNRAKSSANKAKQALKDAG